MPELIWQQIEALLRSAKDRVIIVAPFIKMPIFSAAIAAIPRSVTDIMCVTRWSAEEVAAGVSDPEIMQEALTDGRPSILLVHNLHAKLYMSDLRCLVGSANLTAKATGKANLPNIELLIETAADRGEVTALLAQLMADSIPATPTVAAEIRARADLLVENGLVSPAIGPERDEMTRWYPTTRAPERLYRVYLGDPRGCPHAILEGVLSDLAHLDLAPGLDRQQFGIAVLERIYTFPEVAELVSSGRTSSVDLEAALLATGGTSTDAAERALILTRWLICFDALLHTVPSGPYDIVRGRQLE